ncbi:hypothetical protein VCRA2120E57_680005 [Vibrio crassostreae]|nr:hypothetical protein VCRA2120E57_680005 [Vibrio crassostreae]
MPCSINDLSNGSSFSIVEACDSEDKDRTIKAIVLCDIVIISHLFRLCNKIYL